MFQSLCSKSRKGFTLVELAVVIVIIGVLAAFGVPRFLKSVERAKAAEAFSYLSAIRDAQERYSAQNGTYASDVSALDIQFAAPTYFTVGTISAGSTSTLQISWTLTLTRAARVRLWPVHRDLHRRGLRQRQQHDRRLAGHQSHGHQWDNEWQQRQHRWHDQQLAAWRSRWFEVAMWRAAARRAARLFHGRNALETAFS